MALALGKIIEVVLGMFSFIFIFWILMKGFFS
jgi:hypothetical protein